MTPVTPWSANRAGLVIDAALAEWERGVRDVADSAVIMGYIRGIGGKLSGGYRNGRYQWCGAFAGHCLMQSGVRPDILRQQAPPELGGIGSTYRLSHLVRLDEARAIRRAADIRPGDVCVVGRAEDRPYGAHIVIARSAVGADGRFATVEGNAHGELHGGAWGEGVILRHRPATPGDSRGFIFGYRPTPADYMSEVTR